MLEIRLLGRFEVRHEGEILAIPSRPAQSLFAYLLLNPGSSHRREKLAGLLAPDSSEEHARSALRHALWRLRKSLGRDPFTGRDYILADEIGVGLDPTAAYSLDVMTLANATGAASTIEELVASVSAYDGELLPGFYEDWVQMKRGQLDATFEHKMRLLLDKLVEAGRWDDVLTWGEHWIAVGATPEAAYRALIVAHAAKGDSARAAAAYRRCLEALRTELGVEPVEATRDLYACLVKGETLPGLPQWSAQPLQGAEPGSNRAIFPDDTAADAPAPGEPPFKGLQYFEVADAGLFYGREALTAQLVQCLQERPLLVVVGASGSGKSSLVRAGLMPALMGGAIQAHDNTHADQDSRAWRYHLITPTAHPLQVLALSLTRESESVTAAATLADDMTRDPRSLGLYLARLGLPDSGWNGGHTFIAVDQFEELFTQCRSEDERAAFIANLMTLVAPAETASASPATLVLTLRADFYAHCADYPELRAALATSQLYIGAMTRDELRRAIQCPAEGAGWPLEPGLVDQLLHDAGDEPGALPLVSHALLETWQRRRGRTMTLSGYAAAGGVSGAIARTAQTTYARLTPEQQAVARNVFLRLTELGEGTQDTRRRAAISEFLPDPSAQPLVESVLAILADARLITVSAEQAEVAHEALIREWPLLREWLREDREGLLVHRQLTDAANSWAEMERDAGELYRGARLTRVLEWTQTGRVDLSQLERAFLEASQAAAEQEAVAKETQRRREMEAAQELARQQRRSASQMRRIAAILAAALVLALALGGLAVMLQGRARDSAQLAQNEQARAQVAAQLAQNEQTLALSRELAAVASSSASDDSQLALLLALEAANRPIRAGLEPPLEAEAALHRVLQTVQRRAVIASEAGVAVSPDGALAAAADDVGTIRLWPAVQWTTTGDPTGEPSSAVSGKPGYHTLNFSTDHRLLADGAEDGSVTVWDTQTGVPVRALTGLGGPIVRIALSDNGNLLAGLGADLTAKVWAIATGKELFSVGPTPAGIVALDLSPNGSELATGDASGAVVVSNTATGGRVSTLTGHFDRILDIRFCGSGRLGVSTPGTVTMWDAVTGERTPDLLGFAPGAVGAFACDRGTDRIAVSGTGQAVMVLEATSNHESAALPNTPGAVDLGFSNDGLFLVVHTPLESAEVWESYGGGELAILPAPHGTGVVAISPDGAHVATGIDRNGGLGLWDIPAAPDGTYDKAFAQPRLRTWEKWHDTAISALAFSPDGLRLATGDSASMVKLADVADLLSPAGVTQAPAAVLKSPDWEHYRVRDFTFSPDGTRLAAVTPDVINPYKPLAIWDIGRPDSGEAPAIQEWTTRDLPQWIYSVAFSPDGSEVALGLRSGLTELRDAADGSRRAAIGGRDWAVDDLAYMPDQQRLITVSREGTYSVWQLPETTAPVGSPVVELFRVRGHDSPISAIALTPDGSRLLTGSTDGTVKLWEAATGRALMTLTQGAAPVTGLSLSTEGERLVVASDAVRVYLLPLKSLMSLANARVRRTLSPEERAKYLHEEAHDPRASSEGATAAPGTPTLAPAMSAPPRRPQHLVRAFVNSWNRMDAFAVGSLFATDFTYALDTVWGRGQLPIASQRILLSVVSASGRGERGRWTLLGCDAPATNQTVLCHLTYMNGCLEALHRPPADYKATFSFEGEKIRSAVGEPRALYLYQGQMYAHWDWAMVNAPDLVARIAAYDQNPPLSWQATTRQSAEAGSNWLKICQGYAASHATK